MDAGAEVGHCDERMEWDATVTGAAQGVCVIEHTDHEYDSTLYVLQGHSECVEYLLLECGAHPNQLTANGVTSPMHMAALRGDHMTSDSLVR